MKSDIRVAAPPPKPLMIFDGDCNFCTLWIRRWQQMTGDAVDYLPSQDPQSLRNSRKFHANGFKPPSNSLKPDGTVYSGAEAVFRTLAKNPNWRWPLRTYENSPVIARITESAYGFVADHRTFFSRLTRWFWGRHVEQPDYFLTRWIFLRALGVIYLVAFVSLWTQISGLIGHNGILPPDQFMSAVQQQCDAQGIGLERFHLLPTLCWFDSSDGFLNFQCAAGTLCAILLIVGIAPAPCLALLWLIYLSLATVGQDFLGFQWDNLLLEAGFLAIFFAPLQFLPRTSRESATVTNRPLAAALAAVQAHVLVRLRETVERRSQLAESHRAHVSLSNPAAADVAGLVCESTAALVSEIFLRRDVCHRAWCAVPDFRAAPDPVFGLRRHGEFADPDSADRQLHVLQFSDARAVPVVAGRFCFAKICAVSVSVVWCSFSAQSATFRPHFRRRWPKAVTIPLAVVVVAISLFQMASMFGVVPVCGRRRPF